MGICSNCTVHRIYRVLHSDISRDIRTTSRKRRLSSFFDLARYFWKHPVATPIACLRFTAFSWSACRRTIPGSFPPWCFLFRLGVSSPSPPPPVVLDVLSLSSDRSARRPVVIKRARTLPTLIDRTRWYNYSADCLT